MLIRFLLVTGLLVILLPAALIALLTQPWAGKIVSGAAQIDVARLQAHVRHLSVDFYPRSHDHPVKLEQAAAYIRHEFMAAGAAVEEQEVPVEGMKYRNIIARFGPQSGPVVVIGAHYDSHGNGSAGMVDIYGHGPQSHTPGADDNASGVAGLLELARLLARDPPQRAVELVAYTLEEPPHFGTEHMGSVRHARSLAAARRDVRLMLSLEMIGYFTDIPGSQSYPLPALSYLYPDRGNFIALAGRFADYRATRRAKALMAGASDVPVASINAPRRLTGIDFSDHRSYWDAGYPALMVTDTAFYRNPHYHRGSDTHDTLDYVRMAQVVQGVYAIARHF